MDEARFAGAGAVLVVYVGAAGVGVFLALTHALGLWRDRPPWARSSS
jgi:hypothetical protein